jgi:quercetin dioxygenase-like cupin family protein
MHITTLTDVPTRELFRGYRARLVHSDRMTFSYVDVDAGASFAEHDHPHEQVIHLLDGEFELTVNGETRRMTTGDVAVVPPGARHRGTALTPCRILDAFAPPREDYRS